MRSGWQFFACLVQVALAAIAIALIRTRVMVNVYFGYYCAFELNDAQMCSPTIGVAATSIVLSGLILLLIGFASNESSTPLATFFQIAGGLMWFGFGIAAAIGVSESDNPLDDYLEALSGARGVVAVRSPGITAMNAGVLQLLQQLTARFGRVAATEQEGRQAWELATQLQNSLTQFSADDVSKPRLREALLKLAAALGELGPALAARPPPRSREAAGEFTGSIFTQLMAASLTTVHSGRPAGGGS
ncbi:hypothetical protein C2E21_4442 [Chlorella sorokiniana]|uniref:Uncharacterized protein n=1 Tax=Chlorella sorokiniana TaxID=3076 RepID=A0A2P6TR08_CHLSO|nr:hypothetical protein C2E21_4442 [Chlorella sorokiniana]|eukprot:PRW56500.1 hypothetical protein C2E21_4442 [Chlorella sorokiniana]